MKRTENTEKINEYLQSSTECFRTNYNVDQNSDPGNTCRQTVSGWLSR